MFRGLSQVPKMRLYMEVSVVGERCMFMEAGWKEPVEDMEVTMPV